MLLATAAMLVQLNDQIRWLHLGVNADDLWRAQMSAPWRSGGAVADSDLGARPCKVTTYVNSSMQP
jgi:hypothetical protein